MADPGGTLQDETSGRFIEGGIDTSWHEPFLVFYSQYPYVGVACKHVGIHRRTFQNHVNRFPDFAEKVEEAKEAAIENLEYTGHELALTKSPYLLGLYLRRHVPGFNEIYRINHSGNVNIKIDAKVLMSLPPDVLQMIVDNKMNDAQLMQVLSEEKYKHLLPSGAVDETAIEMEAGSEGTFEMRGEDGDGAQTILEDGGNGDGGSYGDE